MIARLPSWSGQRTARYLVGWWLGSIVVLAWLVAYALLPFDVRLQWLSLQTLEIVGFIAAGWLVPGFVLGGWKALLVAVGRSSITTGTDKTLIVLFSVWAIGWPLYVAFEAIRYGLF